MVNQKISLENVRLEKFPRFSATKRRCVVQSRCETSWAHLYGYEKLSSFEYGASLSG